MQYSKAGSIPQPKSTNIDQTTQSILSLFAMPHRPTTEVQIPHNSVTLPIPKPRNEHEGSESAAKFSLSSEAQLTLPFTAVSALVVVLVVFVFYYALCFYYISTGGALFSFDICLCKCSKLIDRQTDNRRAAKAE